MSAGAVRRRERTRAAAARARRVPALIAPSGRAWRGGLLTVGLLAACSLGAAVPHAAAEDADPVPPPSTQCQLTDPRLPEVSGLVVTADGSMLTMNDGGDAVDLYVLDAGCQVTNVYSKAIDPYDPEDLALGSDGTVWFADTGDNNAVRETVALIALRPDGTNGVYRFTYPDGPHDAEALLLAPDGTPYIVTKEVLGASHVYRPAAAPDATAPVALVDVASVNLTLTNTPGGPVGRASQLLVTGGAVAADGHAIALRTYTDAYVWQLSGSDVPAALGAQPVRVPLPESPQGEAVSFSVDGASLVVASEGLPSDVTVVPVPAQTVVAPVTSEGLLDDVLPDENPDGVPLWAAAAAAAGIATVAVWLIGRVRRRVPPRP